MRKKRMIAAVCVAVLWFTVGMIDYVRAHSFEKPIFCIGTELADDGGSGKYVGLGYSFDLEGNFMPEDESPGVTKWTYYLFGVEIETQIRDEPIQEAEGRLRSTEFKECIYRGVDCQRKQLNPSTQEQLFSV